MLEIVFWCLITVIVYVYAGYPAFLWLVVRPKPEKKHPVRGAERKVTVIISAFNEEECIAEKLENSLRLDYPPELLEIIVVSDASSDGTDRIVNGYAQHGINLLRMAERGGKTLGLNAGVDQASGEIVVFSDANAMYQRDAIHALAEPFADPGIGAVVGEAAYSVSGSDAGRSESLYWRYETAIKELESAKGSVVGGDGAIYGVRKDLYKPMRADALSDFINPLQVVQAGFRCVYDRRALAFEETAESFYKEYRRKVRIVNRAWRATLSMREMLNPLKYGWFSVKFWSHKVLRWWVPLLMLGALVTNALLAPSSKLYTAMLLLQVVFYTLAAIGFARRGNKQQSGLFRIPFYFCLVNVASATGLVEAMFGKSYTTWTTAREGS